MVTIVDYEQRKNADSEVFFTLTLEGGIETIISSKTGRPYLTAKRASIPTTFDERKCQTLIGSSLPGGIQKEECDAYEFIIPDSGDTIILEHRYVYVAQEMSEEDSVFAEDCELP